MRARPSLLLPLVVVTALAAAFVALELWPPVAPAATDAVRERGTAAASSAAGGSSAAERATTTDALQRDAVATTAAAALGAEPLHGTISGPGDAPCAGARVAAATTGVEEYSLLDRARNSASTVVATAASRADGTYELALPQGRHYTLRVDADGFAPAVRSGCQAGARVDVQLMRGATLAGVVRDTSGRPVPDTRIVVRQTQAPGPPRRAGEATTDAAGSYRIHELPAGTVLVDVRPRTLAMPRDVDVTLVAGGTTVHDVVLLDGVTIRGRVLDDATGEGIAGAEVREGHVGRTVTTAGDGAFTLPGFAPQHNLALHVRAAGYADVEKMLRGRGSKPEDTLRDVELRLRRGYAVRGRVVDAAGNTLAGVYVAAAAADMRGDNDWFRSDWRSTESAADGTFTIGSLRRDMQHELMLVRAGFATVVHALPAPAANGDVDAGDVRLRAPASLSGTVVDEQDQPVADHDVALAGHNADRWRLSPRPHDGYRALDGYVAERNVRTDDRGRFHFADLAAGDYELRLARADSHELTGERITVHEARAESGVVLRVFRGAAIAGRITASDGGPVPKCYCSIDPEDGQRTSGDVEASPDGSFRAGGLEPGRYKVTIYPYAADADRVAGRSFVPREYTNVVAGSTQLLAEIVVQRAVTGTVLGADRAPAAGVYVHVCCGSDDLGGTTTGADGTFTLPARAGRPLRVFVLRAVPTFEAPLDVGKALCTADTTAGADPLLLVLPPR